MCATANTAGAAMNTGLRRVACLKPLMLVVAIAITPGCDLAPRPPQYQMIPAVAHGDMARVEELLNDTENVDINWRAGGTGTTALITAADFNQVAIAQLLLSRRADPNIGTDENKTPLLSAAFQGHVEMVRILIDAGADVNAAETRYGYAPLLDAASHGHVDVIRLLLDAGADREARVKDGRTAVQLAEHFGHFEAASVLRNYQAGAADDETESEQDPAKSDDPKIDVSHFT